MGKKQKLPRIMLAAPASGSGKTLVTCGLLQALENRKKQVISFKCGPDYIDPMFHRKIIGVASRNLDPFFTDEETTRYLFGRQAEKAELSVIEGVMGFYDGLGGITPRASSWDLARITETPVILIVNARGMSLSVTALIRGFLEAVPDMADGQNHCRDSYIRGVILNQATASMYPALKEQIEQKLPVKVLGYVPRLEDCVIESRHLGLVTPEEIGDLGQRVLGLADVLEQTLDMDGILGLAEEAPGLDVDMPEALDAFLENSRREAVKRPAESRGRETGYLSSVNSIAGEPQLRIAVARDEAFCFYYEDNLELLERLGAVLVEFSPVHDKKLPGNIRGILFGGGYPELYAEQLSGNHSMVESVRAAAAEGTPYLAECGGFMYLHETMEDMKGKSWPMAGVLPGHVKKTDRLGRFGYVTLTAKKPQIFGAAGEQIRAHEFHYFDSSYNGDAFHARKPAGKRSWDCIVAGENFAAGFPHLYYYSNPEFAEQFVEACRKFNT